jgi:tubulin epsilon
MQGRTCCRRPPGSRNNRFYTHHYEQYMDKSAFDHAVEVVADVTARYSELDGATAPPAVPRLRPRGLTFL